MHPNKSRCAKHERDQLPQEIVFPDKRIGKEKKQKSFVGTFWISDFTLNENEVFVRACGRARP
jgi:hypothetical protein